MIRDRGKIKWTSLMLPEHVSLLREWAQEDSYETRNELDEQKIEEINQIIAEAMEYGTAVRITYYKTNARRYESVEGCIHFCNDQARKLHIAGEGGEIYFVPYAELTDVQLIGETR
ncbi:YolD-like family protein [Pradoshia sp.]|uniref:YolD-like family protein n=1 Tax=Pradoshia sp. TaxID=2651281 RepID=UPI003F0C90AE